MSIYRFCRNYLAQLCGKAHIGEIDYFEIIQGSGGQQLTIIDGVQYTTWIDVIEFPVLKGCIVMHKPYIETAFDEEMLVTNIIKIMSYPTIPDNYPYCN